MNECQYKSINKEPPETHFAYSRGSHGFVIFYLEGKVNKMYADPNQGNAGCTVQT